MKLDNKNIKQLDGIRGISILIVFFSHIGLGHLVPGGFGVTVFFFISGFLIAKLLLHELQLSTRINFRNFYIRRAFRLYPALLFFTALTVLVLLLHGVGLIPSQLFAALFYLENYYYVYFINYQEVHLLYSIFKILWSLSIEEHYYLFYPVFLVATHRHTGLHIGLSVLLLLIPLLLRIHYANSLVDPHLFEKYNYSLTHTRIDSILYGSLLAYLLYKSRYSARAYAFLRNRFVLIIAIAVLLLTFIWRDDVFRETFRYSLQGLFLAPLIVFTIYGGNSWLNRMFFCNDLLVYIGKLSYSIYLFHWLAIPLASYHFVKFGMTWQAFVVLLTVGLSLFSYYRVEMPFVKLRKKFGSNV
ncbi:acyltransferase family protein [Sphingobacterium suaedae]|uniref:Acyltransferase family protein n=1 Tax=Sphingobacterium suaedae TaxID=1686402 RepID=A0ABW5KP11_9SPHI